MHVLGVQTITGVQSSFLHLVIANTVVMIEEHSSLALTHLSKDDVFAVKPVWRLAAGRNEELQGHSILSTQTSLQDCFTQTLQ